MGELPLLAADDLRIDEGGASACDRLTFATTKDRVLVLGAPRALFAAATGLLPVARGTLSVRGEAAIEAARGARMAGAALDPPLPPRFTVREYVAWSARLAGAPASAIDPALERLALGPLAKTRLDRAVAHARRATVVAAALATGADAIAIEDPLAGLAADVAETFAGVLVRALADRVWIVFAPSVPLASPLAVAAGEALVATSSRIVAQGSPVVVAAQDRRFVMRALGDERTILEALATRDITATAHGGRFLVDLGANATTGELVASCAAAGVAIVELAPVARALA